MEYRDKLLSSEIRHLTDLVSMLSYELLIVQDFMQEQFGGKFKRFRNQHLLSSETRNTEALVGQRSRYSSSGVTRSSTNVSGVERCNNREAGNRRYTVGSNREGVQSDQNDEDPNAGPETDANSSGIDPLRNQDEPPDSEANLGDDPLDVEHVIPLDSFAVASEEEEGYSNIKPKFEDDPDYDPETTPKPGKQLGGRKGIWTKFTCVRLPDGRKLARCNNCNRTVSPVAKRLEKHYLACVPGSKLPTLVSPSAANRLLRTPGEPSSVKRKPASFVWKHFDKIINPEGTVSMSCKFCQKKVSYHATRMMRHLQMCPEAEDLDLEQSFS